MRTTIIFVILTTILSCTSKTKNNQVAQPLNQITGTWQLLTGTIIEKGDTAITDYTKTISFIKIINNTHFAFLKHDLNKGKDSAAVFVAGGGSYSINDSLYTERLEYCSARNWEGNHFAFTVTIKNDTLTQTGIEKIESEGVNRLNIEKYIRVKK